MQLVIFSYGDHRGIISSFVKAKTVGSKHEVLEKSMDTGHIIDCTSEQVFAPLAHYVKRAKSSSSNNLKKSILKLLNRPILFGPLPQNLARKLQVQVAMADSPESLY